VNATLTVAAPPRSAERRLGHPLRVAPASFLRAARVLFTQLDARRAIKALRSGRDRISRDPPPADIGRPAREVVAPGDPAGEDRRQADRPAQRSPRCSAHRRNDFFYLDDRGPTRKIRAPPALSHGGPLSAVRRDALLVPVVTTLGGSSAWTSSRRGCTVGCSQSGNRRSARNARGVYVRLGSGPHRPFRVAAAVVRRPATTGHAPPAAPIGERMPVARSHGAAFDNNLFGITPRPDVPLEALQAALNATITRLEIELSARELTGAQAVADTNVYLVKALLLPRADLLRARAGALGRALAPLAARLAGSIAEAGCADGRALDAAAALRAAGRMRGCAGGPRPRDAGRPADRRVPPGRGRTEQFSGELSGALQKKCDTQKSGHQLGL
jgi:hypothetical protein